MADKTISELVAATAVGSNDLFVLEQSNTAKKLTGQTLENWLVSFADGHGGIQSIQKTGTSGTNPVIDTYTITLADTTTFSFTVTNGLKGDTGAQTYVWIKWAAQNPTADNQLSNIPDAWIGIYTGTASTAPTSRTSYTWYEYKGQKGDTGAGIDSVTRTSGTGAPGTSDTYTMYAGGTSVGTFDVYNGSDGQGAPGSQTPLVDSGSGVVGEAAAYSREDHQHPLNVDSTNPAALGTASPGSASTYARRDHVHPKPSASDIGAAPASGFTSLTATLAAASWTNNTQTLSNSAFVVSGRSYIVTPAGASLSAYGEAQIYADNVTVAGQMTFHCTTVPESDLTVNILRVVS